MSPVPPVTLRDLPVFPAVSPEPEPAPALRAEPTPAPASRPGVTPNADVTHSAERAFDALIAADDEVRAREKAEAAAVANNEALIEAVAARVIEKLAPNGVTDLVHIVGGDYVHPWLSKGNGTFALSTFCPAPRYNSKSGRWITTDLNGDRKTDLVHLVQDSYVHPWVSGADESSYANVFSVPGGAPCPGCPTAPNVTVWANTASGVYHCSGSRYYGNTKAGSYMTQKQAQDIGYRPAYGRVCKG